MAQTQQWKTSSMPPIGENPLQRAYEDYHIMENELLAARDRMRAQDMTITDLMRESDFTRSQLAKVTTERDRLQAYAIDLTSRLAVIRETIDHAQSAAMQTAIKPAEAPAAAPVDKADESSVTVVRAAGIEPVAARGLPINKFG